jgi:calcineurin-like phosphoesterase family protein
MGKSGIFITGDNHLFHAAKQDGKGGIINHAHRIDPRTGLLFSSIEVHDEYQIQRWNETVDKNGLVYILGDFCWKQHNHFIMALNGKKILVTGSHDKTSQINLANFTEVHHGMLCRIINNQYFVMTHCPMLTWEHSHHGSINLHGHAHGRVREDDDVKRMDCGVDVADRYAPFSLEFILYKMSLKNMKDYQYENPDKDKYVVINKENNINLMEEFNKNLH